MMEARKQMQFELKRDQTLRWIWLKNMVTQWNQHGKINDLKGVKIDAEYQEPGDLEARKELK